MSRVSRREAIKKGALAGVALAAARRTPAQQKKGRPNILLIIDDQHSPRAMGWTGETPVQTPALDRLASESVCFTNGYASSPVCAPTRHTIYSGLYPSEHGVITNDLPMREGIPTLMTHLNEAGYTTANIGKMHNCPYHHRREFQYVLHHEFFIGAGGISHYAAFLAAQLKQRGRGPGPPWSTPAAGKRNWLEDAACIAGTNWVPEDLTAERWITDRSLEFIREQLANRPDKPFFLHASYFPPHHPYRPIEKYARLYDPAAVALPPNFSRGKADAWCTGRSRPDHLSDDDYKRLRAFYFGFVTQLDAEIGRLLEGLRELGLADNTVVFFMSDHGDMIGEHGALYKGLMYEGSVRVPFMVRWPGVGEARKEPTLVSHADIMPTILRAAGLEPDAHLLGTDLRPLIAGEAGWPERSVYSEFLPRLPFTHLMLRRGAHKLIASAAGPDRQSIRYQLYDVESDPWEMHDLADDPAHAGRLKELRDELTERWERQRQHMPEKQPEIPARSRYDIPWPADPWEAVEPA